MKIIAVHHGFACDHSSTSYEFLAVDKPLGQKARSEVASLSSRACPTERSVSFVYHADGYDIPGGWEALMREHYDVMYSESYGWWTFAMAFDAPKEQQEALMQYEFSDGDDLGVSVSCSDARVVVAVNCRADGDSLYALGATRDGDEFDDDYGFGEEDEEDEDDDGESSGAAFESDDGLLNLLTRVREQLVEGDYRALYAVWKVYGPEDEAGAEDVADGDGPPTQPPDREDGQEAVDEFRELLAAE